MGEVERLAEWTDAGIRAAQAGCGRVAHAQLEQAVLENPLDVRAWLWLAWLSDSPATARQALQQALAIAPGDEVAELGLHWLNALEHSEAPAGEPHYAPSPFITASDPAHETPFESHPDAQLDASPDSPIDSPVDSHLDARPANSLAWEHADAESHETAEVSEVAEEFDSLQAECDFEPAPLEDSGEAPEQAELDSFDEPSSVHDVQASSDDGVAVHDPRGGGVEPDDGMLAEFSDEVALAQEVSDLEQAWEHLQSAATPREYTAASGEYGETAGDSDATALEAAAASNLESLPEQSREEPAAEAVDPLEALLAELPSLPLAHGARHAGSHLHPETAQPELVQPEPETPESESASALPKPLTAGPAPTAETDSGVDQDLDRWLATLAAEASEAKSRVAQSASAHITPVAPGVAAPSFAPPIEAHAVDPIEAQLLESVPVELAPVPFAPAAHHAQGLPLDSAAPDSSGAPLIMTVDDSPTVRKLVTMTLEHQGYRVLTAADGLAALPLISSEQPALILLDINMPRLDGYKLCKLIKKHEKTQSIPVVMLSGKDGLFDRFRGALVGCNDYLTKPFDTQELLRTVAKYCPAPAVV